MKILIAYHRDTRWRPPDIGLLPAANRQGHCCCA